MHYSSGLICVSSVTIMLPGIQASFTSVHSSRRISNMAHCGSLIRAERYLFLDKAIPFASKLSCSSYSLAKMAEGLFLLLRRVPAWKIPSCALSYRFCCWYSPSRGLLLSHVFWVSEIDLLRVFEWLLTFRSCSYPAHLDYAETLTSNLCHHRPGLSCAGRSICPDLRRLWMRRCATFP